MTNTGEIVENIWHHVQYTNRKRKILNGSAPAKQKKVKKHNIYNYPGTCSTTYIHTYIHVHMCTCTYIHTYIHTYIYIQLCTYICIPHSTWHTRTYRVQYIHTYIRDTYYIHTYMYIHIISTCTINNQLITYYLFCITCTCTHVPVHVATCTGTGTTWYVLLRTYLYLNIHHLLLQCASKSKTPMDVWPHVFFW